MYKSNYHKKSELISTLNERGMTTLNPDILDEVNYSHIIYKFHSLYLVEDSKEIKYKSGTDLKHLYELFLLNGELSSILYKAFNKIEHKLRSSIIKHIAVDNPLFYLEPESYSNATRENEVDEFIESLIKTERNKRYLYNKKHYINGKLPIWLLIDELPIGQLRMFLKLTGIQTSVLKDVNIKRRKWWVIKTFNTFRNIVAHMDVLVSVRDGVVFNVIFKYIENNYKSHYDEFMTKLNAYDWTRTNITKEEYLSWLGI